MIDKEGLGNTELLGIKAGRKLLMRLPVLLHQGRELRERHFHVADQQVKSGFRLLRALFGNQLRN